jgi:hypothetical protein
MKQPVLNVPENVSDLLDVLNSMLLNAPKYTDKTGYLPFLNLDYSFRELNEGLAFNRRKLGEERYRTLLRKSDEARALFEADPDKTTGETTKGRGIICEMIEILRPPRPSSAPNS